MPVWHTDYQMEADGAEMSAVEFRRPSTENLETVGVGGMQEDDITAASGGGGISSDRPSSFGGAASHVEQRTADRARAIIAVKDILLHNGVESHVMADILGRLAMAV